MFVIIGCIVVIGAVLGGFTWAGGHVEALIHPSEIVTIGGAFFLASDSILAFRLFLPEALPGWMSPAVMITYTIGQGLIVWGVLHTLARRGTR